MAKLKVTLKQLLNGIELSSGEEHTLELAFSRHSGLIVEGSLFAFDSAFPAAGIFQHLEVVQEELEAQPGTRIVIFGHADLKGTEAYNKLLSERRAKATLALVRRDVQQLDAVAKEEDWGVAQYQVMLRVLGCNPGAIDGVAGKLTQSAMRGFQRGYNEGIYHQDSPARACPDLVVDGELGPKTKAALRDAYTVNSPCHLDKSRVNNPSFAGCSEFNPVSDKDEDNRRVVIAMLGTDAPASADYPCKLGKISACPRDKQAKMRCMFYREHFRDQRRIEVPPFYDFRWLREKNGAAHLSALTPLPDGPAQFTIYRYEPDITDPMPNSNDSGARPTQPGTELGRLDGEIRGGVAFARWQPPDDFDPFDYGNWLVDHDLDLEVFEGDQPNGGPVDPDALFSAKAMHPPVFMVEASGQWGFSCPPSENLDEIRITQDSTGPGMAIGYDGGLVPWQATAGRTSPRNALPPDVGVLALLMASREVAPEDGDDGDTETET